MSGLPWWWWWSATETFRERDERYVLVGPRILISFAFAYHKWPALPLFLFLSCYASINIALCATYLRPYHPFLLSDCSGWFSSLSSLARSHVP